MSIKKRDFTWYQLKWKATFYVVFGLKYKAMDVFEELYSLYPDDDYAISSLAFMKTQMGDKSGALTEYIRLVHLPKATAAHWYNLGFLQEEMGQIENAEFSFRQSIKLNEKFDQAYYGLGLTLIQLKRFDEAIKALRKNTQLQPMSPYAWYQLARLYVEREQPDEASKIISHLKNFEPKFAKQLERETGLAG